MTPEQELRLECLSLAVEAGACPDCALDVAADFEAYVRDGEPPDGDDGDDPDDDDSVHALLWGRPHPAASLTVH